MKSWLTKHYQDPDSRFYEFMDNLHFEAKLSSQNTETSLDHIFKETYYIKALDIFNWIKNIKRNSILLDMECTIGCKTAELSKLKNKKIIYYVVSYKLYKIKMMAKIFNQRFFFNSYVKNNCY